MKKFTINWERELKINIFWGYNLLGKMKIYELAKQMNIESKKLVDIAIKNGIDVKSHLSTIEDEEAEKLKKILSGNTENKTKWWKRNLINENLNRRRKVRRNEWKIKGKKRKINIKVIANIWIWSRY